MSLQYSVLVVVGEFLFPYMWQSRVEIEYYCGTELCRKTRSKFNEIFCIKNTSTKIILCMQYNHLLGGRSQLYLS